MWNFASFQFEQKGDKLALAQLSITAAAVPVYSF